MKKLTLLLLLLSLTLLLTSCRDIKDDRPVIYTTVYAIEYLASEIGGDTIYVERVPGSNVHSEAYDWSAKEIISMQKASLIFYIGANLDNYIPDNKETIFDEGSVKLVYTGDYIEYSQICYQSHSQHNMELLIHLSKELFLGLPEDDEDTIHDVDVCEESQLADDPHFWLDPAKVIVAAEMVKDNLVEQFPDNEAIYTANYDALLIELNKLLTEYQVMAAEVTKPIITTNMLFNYWNESFGIEILSLTADAHTSNTIPSDIIDFVNEAYEHDIRFILFETNSNSPAGDAVLDELKSLLPDASKRYIHGLGSLTQEEIDNGEDYLSCMYKNLEVLKEVTK